MRLNALVASPSFAAWGRGPALDPRVLLRTEDGKPRAAVIYLAHLSDEERQLVVTLVLSRLITWMHEQPGTSELRALVYLDEVYGFAPPTAAPPSKKPILTLLKRARAFGIGMVVATQNPVDLDYKAMANAGSWFIGRLQTENDKKRVLEGLRSAAGGVDVDKLDTAIGGARAAPVPAPERAPRRAGALLHPLGDVVPARAADEGADRDADAGRGEGNDVGRHAESAATAEATPAPRSPTTRAPSRRRSRRSTAVRYLDPAAPWASSIGAEPERQAPAGLPRRPRQPALRRHEGRARHDPGVGGALRPARRRPRPRRRDRPSTTTTATSATSRVDGGELRALRPRRSTRSRSSATRRRSIQRRVDGPRRRSSSSAARGSTSTPGPGETREQFEARADEAAQAAADAETAKIRDRLEAKRDRLDRALETARRKVEEAETEQSSRRSTELLSGVGSVIGVLLGGKANTRTIARAGRALGSAAGRRGMTSRAGERKRTAEERVESGRGRPRSARAGAARRGGRDRREVAGEGRRDRDGRDPARGDRRARRRDDARLGADRLSRAFAAAALAALAGCGGEAEPAGSTRPRRRPPSPSSPTATRSSSPDGRRVRLLQVDAPELFGECYGPAAHVALRQPPPRRLARPARARPRARRPRPARPPPPLRHRRRRRT